MEKIFKENIEWIWLIVGVLIILASSCTPTQHIREKVPGTKSIEQIEAYQDSIRKAEQSQTPPGLISKQEAKRLMR